MSPDQALQLRRAAAPGNRQQHRFGLPRSHPGDCPHLGVTQYSVAERRIDARQTDERPGDADALPGGTGPEPAAVVQPVAEIAVAAFIPAAPAVHRGDELDEAPIGVVDVAGHACDGATQFGGIVGDEVEITGAFEGGAFGSVFANDLGALERLFGRLRHHSCAVSVVSNTVYNISILNVCHCFH